MAVVRVETVVWQGTAERCDTRPLVFGAAQVAWELGRVVVEEARVAIGKRVGALTKKRGVFTRSNGTEYSRATNSVSFRIFPRTNRAFASFTPPASFLEPRWLILLSGSKYKCATSSSEC